MFLRAWATCLETGGGYPAHEGAGAAFGRQHQRCRRPPFGDQRDLLAERSQGCGAERALSSHYLWLMWLAHHAVGWRRRPGPGRVGAGSPELCAVRYCAAIRSHCR